MIRFLCSVVLALISLATAPAFATDPALIFRRDMITISPDGYQPATPSTEVQAGAAPQEKIDHKKLKDRMEKEDIIYDIRKKKAPKKSAPPARMPVKINTEIRSDQALKLDWIASLNRMKDDEGVMILFTPPVQLSLMPMNVYDPLDVLFVDREGRIMQIAPNIDLLNLSDGVQAKSAVRAWFFLKGGEAERLRIQPGDWVQHPLFRPKPTILQ